jgi:hypothetical protein
VFTVGGLTFGIVICRDSTYSELARGMVPARASARVTPRIEGDGPV